VNDLNTKQTPYPFANLQEALAFLLYNQKFDTLHLKRQFVDDRVDVEMFI
jgi:hypothetical protein